VTDILLSDCLILTVLYLLPSAPALRHQLLWLWTLLGTQHSQWSCTVAGLFYFLEHLII